MLPVSLAAKSLQEFATVLRNLEDERMRMVQPRLSWDQGVVAPGHPGDSDCQPQSSFPRLEWSCRGGQREERVGLARKHLKSVRNGVLLLESGQCWCWGGAPRFAETQG